MVTSAPDDLAVLVEGLAGKGIEVKDSEIVMVPSNTIKLDEKDAGKILRLRESIEDHEDVRRVRSNFDIDEEVLEKLAGDQS